jgi:predicted lactoylglutathione lyase
MSSQIFVNLPVADLQRSREFFGSLGYLFNPQLSDDNAACLVIDEDHIYVMLVEHDYYMSITEREIADTAVASEVMITLTVKERDDVEALMQRVIDAGGARAKEPEDFGYLYRRGFFDTDGHHWEIMWMQPNEEPVEQLMAVAEEASATADEAEAVAGAEAITAEAARADEAKPVLS